MIRSQMAGTTGFRLSGIRYGKLMSGMADGTGSNGSIRIPCAYSTGPGFINRLVVRAQLDGSTVTHLAAGRPWSTTECWSCRRCAFIPRIISFIHKTGALIMELQFDKLAAYLGSVHYCFTGQHGMSAFKELLNFLGMTTRTGLWWNHRGDINICSLDAFTLAGHGWWFFHHMAIVAWNPGMAHSAGTPAFHNTGHLLAMAFNAA